ncbi:hypothetical protein KXT41_26895, partial [Salmonella enterica subsp. enterica serovar Weltevreden]|nr:hypothetical protein [Salmonella enterica subsp. enterica serovar Weltevreden]
MIVIAELTAVNAHQPLMSVTFTNNPEFNLSTVSSIMSKFTTALIATKTAFDGHHFTSTPIPAMTQARSIASFTQR